MSRVIEVRTYRLVAGSRARFHQLVDEVSLPMARAAGMDIVAYGPTLNDPDGYFLIRAFASLEDLVAQQERFYSSRAWREGPRAAIIAEIESDANAVFEVSEAAIEALRAAMPPVRA